MLKMYTNCKQFQICREFWFVQCLCGIQRSKNQAISWLGRPCLRNYSQPFNLMLFEHFCVVIGFWIYGCFQSPGKRKGGASASKLFHLGQLLKRLVVTMWVKKTTISSRFLNVCKEVGWLYWEMWKCIVKLLNFQFLPYLHFSETAGKIQSRTWEIERKSN